MVSNVIVLFGEHCAPSTASTRPGRILLHPHSNRIVLLIAPQQSKHPSSPSCCMGTAMRKTRTHKFMPRVWKMVYTSMATVIVSARQAVML